MSTELHERDRLEKTPFEVYTPHVRKELLENRRKSSKDWHRNELDPDERRGRETGDDGLDVPRATWATDVQKPGVCEENVRASGEGSKEGGRRDDFAVGEEIVSDSVVARFGD